MAILELVFLLFPRAQFLPRWTRWTLVVLLVAQVPSTFFPDAPFTFNTNPSSVGFIILVANAPILCVARLYPNAHCHSHRSFPSRHLPPIPTAAPANPANYPPALLPPPVSCRQDSGSFQPHLAAGTGPRPFALALAVRRSLADASPRCRRG